MRLLLDTHLLLWAAARSERLPREARELLEDGANEVYYSAASIWEIAIKFPLGKLHLTEPPETYVPSRIRLSGLEPLPVTHEHALAVASLPRFPDHRDPFDRLLVATARVERMTLVSADPVFRRYDVELMQP